MELINAMEPWMIPIIVMFFVTLIVAMGIGSSLLKSKLKQNSGSNLSQNKEFLDALRDFKESMERRVSNLEAIVTDEEPPSDRTTQKSDQKTGTTNRITDIEMDDLQDEDSVKPGSNKLKNMLNQ